LNDVISGFYGAPGESLSKDNGCPHLSSEPSLISLLPVCAELPPLRCFDELLASLMSEPIRMFYAFALSFPVGGFIDIFDVFGLCGYAAANAGFLALSWLWRFSEGLFEPANLLIESDYLRSTCHDLTFGRKFLRIRASRSRFSISLLILAWL